MIWRTALPERSERSTLVPTVLRGNAVPDALRPRLLAGWRRCERTTRSVADDIPTRERENEGSCVQHAGKEERGK